MLATLRVRTGVVLRSGSCAQEISKLSGKRFASTSATNDFQIPRSLIEGEPSPAEFAKRVSTETNRLKIQGKLDIMSKTQAAGIIGLVLIGFNALEKAEPHAQTARDDAMAGNYREALNEIGRAADEVVQPLIGLAFTSLSVAICQKIVGAAGALLVASKVGLTEFSLWLSDATLPMVMLALSVAHLVAVDYSQELDAGTITEISGGALSVAASIVMMIPKLTPYGFALSNIGTLLVGVGQWWHDHAQRERWAREILEASGVAANLPTKVTDVYVAAADVHRLSTLSSSFGFSPDQMEDIAVNMPWIIEEELNPGSLQPIANFGAASKLIEEKDGKADGTKLYAYVKSLGWAARPFWMRLAQGPDFGARDLDKWCAYIRRSSLPSSLPARAGCSAS